MASGLQGVLTSFRVPGDLFFTTSFCVLSEDHSVFTKRSRHVGNVVSVHRRLTRGSAPVPAGVGAVGRPDLSTLCASEFAWGSPVHARR